jgi:hypothetical protein
MRSATSRRNQTHRTRINTDRTDSIAVKARLLSIAVSLMSAAGDVLLKDALGSLDPLVRETAEYLTSR